MTSDAFPLPPPFAALCKDDHWPRRWIGTLQQEKEDQ